MTKESLLRGWRVCKAIPTVRRKLCGPMFLIEFFMGKCQILHINPYEIQDVIESTVLINNYDVTRRRLHYHDARL